MIDYEQMPYGYSLDMNITDLCNIQCSHCYMKKRDLFLTFQHAKIILDKLPQSLKRIVLSGGEPFLNYDVMYQIVDYARKRFGNTVKIRISSNGKFFYETDDEIIAELRHMESSSINQILLSNDKYHIDAGIKLERLIRIGELATENNLKIKVKYLNIGNEAPVGESKERDENKIEKKKCLNRPENVFSPYLFTKTDGNVYVCAFRSLESLGNLFYDDWNIIANNIQKQYAYLCGNVMPEIIRKDSSNKNCENFLKYGECYLCQNH